MKIINLFIIGLGFVLVSCNIYPQTVTIASTHVITPDMIKVEGGTFMMGSNDSDALPEEKPIHSVTVGSFNIGKYDVTQKEYQDLMGNNPSGFTGNNLPVEYVSWFDAIKFCNAKNKKENLPASYKEDTGELLDSSGITTTDISKVNGYRLPTEAEWEYAARGGNKSKGVKYAGSNSADEVAWYINNSGNTTHDVGNKAANELGLYDMSGNVWQWCTDLYESNYYSKSPSSNPYNNITISPSASPSPTSSPLASPSSTGSPLVSPSPTDSPSASLSPTSSPLPSPSLTGSPSVIRSPLTSPRVVRGGCWLCNIRDVRTLGRGNLVPTYRYNYFGFRLVKN